MEVRRASELGEGAREKISEVFLDGFYGDLKVFSKDKARLARALAHMFRLEYFYAAVIDGEIAGIAALAGMSGYCVRPRLKELARHLGPLRGLFASLGLRVFGRDPKYPPQAGADGGTASVEFVATSEKHRKKGAAAAILSHLHCLPGCSGYILEVKDTNAPALALYEKMGYRETHREKFRWAKFADFNWLVYMMRPKG
jgi:ribosomal protein S18 acetylase RimI-like enzyme